MSASLAGSMSCDSQVFGLVTTVISAALVVSVAFRKPHLAWQALVGSTVGDIRPALTMPGRATRFEQSCLRLPPSAVRENETRDPVKVMICKSQKLKFSAARRTGRAMLCRLPVALIAFGMVGAVAISSASAQGLPLIRDTEIEALLKDYSRPIFKVAGLERQRIRMRIVKQRAFNAFVVDGRNVFINTGTLMLAKTPNQVIGVIAHETGHIRNGHLARLRHKIKRDATRSLLMKVLGVGLLVAGGIAGGEQAKEAAGGAGKSILYGTDEVLRRSILSYVRTQESEADQAALQFLYQTKQSARGMLETFERFANQEYLSTSFKDPYVRSHPMATQRLAQLRHYAALSPYFNKPDPPQLQLRHDLMRAKLSGYLEAPRTVFNRYPASDRTLPARYARALGHFFRGDLAAARPRIDALIRAQPEYPYFWELKGELLLRANQPSAAIAPLRKALKLTNRAPLIATRLSQALLSTNDQRYLKEAVSLLRTAVRIDPDATGFRLLASAYYKQRRFALAILYQAEAHLIAGRIKEAKRFAKRALLKLKKGTTAWLRADDIVKIRS